MVNHRNEKTSSHILTIEDPIEFYHYHKKSTVNQREVGSDTETFGLALRAAGAGLQVTVAAFMKNRDSAEFGMLDLGRNAEVPDLRFRECLVDRVDRAAGHAGLVQ